MKQRLVESWVLLTADKRKATTLAILLVAAGGLLVRMMILGGKPATASAESSVIIGGSSDQRTKPDSGALSQFEILSLVILPRSERLKRDLFAPGPAFGPQPLQTDSSDGSGPKSAQGSDDKSPVSPELRRLVLERAVREEASRLHLSSIMIGPNPIAVIQQNGMNGTRTVLRVGEFILGFELVEVSARNAVLMKNGIRVDLSIGRRERRR